MSLRRLAPLVLLSALALPAVAQEADVTAAERQQVLFEALELPRILDVMRREGIDNATQLAADLFPGRNGEGWRETVEGIYDIDLMTDSVSADFATALAEAEIEPMVAFFTSGPGETIVDLEARAREALLDDAVERAANEAAAVAIHNGTERFRLVEDLAEANELIEYNVVGALNSNAAFYLGLLDGGAVPAPMTEDQVLADVWTQEEEIRADTTQWIYSYLLMAYQPLSDADLEAYIAFSRSEAGQALNRAFFDAFDAMFDEVSRALGLAAARHMATQEL